MILIACLPGGVLILLMIWLWNRRPDVRVSSTWLSEQAQSESRHGYDGVAWRWPRTSNDDDGLFNRFVERIRR